MKKSPERVTKICTLCEKPHKAKTHLCVQCNKKAKDLGKILPHIKGKASISKLLWLKEKYNTNDIFDILFKKPYLYWDGSDRKVRQKFKRETREHHRSDSYRNENYSKWESNIPSYILNEMKKHPSKQLLTLSGDRLNPNIHYLCKLCNKEQVQKFDDIANNRTHNCSATKSSGELIVESYLKKFAKFKTQFDTLKCFNPITKRQLPYDFEISNSKILIEVQGQQHLKFIEYFHGTIENFHYQLRKDAYKKAFAEKHGYKLIYIYYDEINDGRYKEKLNQIKKAL